MFDEEKWSSKKYIKEDKVMVISSVNNAVDTSLNETDMKPILQTIRVEEVEDREATPEEENMFALASLM